MYDLFSDFFDGFDIFPQISHEQKRCPKCGRSYSDFSKYGKFGCAECYNTFNNVARRVIAQTQKSPTHKGKIPSRAGAALKKQQRYNELKSQLSAAVKNEDYEEAARLHKQIRALEQERGE